MRREPSMPPVQKKYLRLERDAASNASTTRGVSLSAPEARRAVDRTRFR